MPILFMIQWPYLDTGDKKEKKPWIVLKPVSYTHLGRMSLANNYKRGNFPVISYFISKI